MKQYFFIISILFLLSCSDKDLTLNKWPEHLKINFLDNCVDKNSTSNECNCLLDKLESSDLLGPFNSRNKLFLSMLEECIEDE